MEDNPFVTMIKAITQVSKSQIPAAFRFGTVASINPLRLDVAGTTQDESAILKNNLIDNFMLGDRLLLAPIEDEQRYIILCKVVSI